QAPLTLIGHGARSDKTQHARTIRARTAIHTLSPTKIARREQPMTISKPNRRTVLAATAAAALLTGATFAASSPAYAAVKTIVLVHGAFADGSGWMPVADILHSHGYSVHIVQPPETSLAADVAATRRILDKAGPCVLVGHSYGGMIITEAGTHPDIKALVYIA